MSITSAVRPPQFNKDKGYERYKQELLAWQHVTDIAKGKQGIVVALSLPENDETGIRERVFDDMKLDDLQKEEGLKNLIAYMDGKLGKDEMADSLEKFDQFEACMKESNQSIMEYISQSDQKYNKIAKLGMTLPPAILAFKLLNKANLSTSEKMLVMTGMDYSKKDMLYTQAKNSLLKFKGQQSSSKPIEGASAAVKFEPSFLAEEVYWTGQRGRGSDASMSNYRGGRPSQRGRWGMRSSRNRGSDRNNRRYTNRPMNAKGSDGRVLLCSSCGSYRHLMAD